jgi:hypothetical protein
MFEDGEAPKKDSRRWRLRVAYNQTLTCVRTTGVRPNLFSNRFKDKIGSRIPVFPGIESLVPRTTGLLITSALTRGLY